MEEKKIETKTMHSNKMWWLVGALVAAVLLFVFGVIAGFSGSRIASHKFAMIPGKNVFFDQRTSGPGGSMMGFGKSIISKPGLNYKLAMIGTVSNISGNTITVNADNGVTQQVVINGTTKITRGSDTLKVSDLKVNDSVTVLGPVSDSNQILAEFVEVK